MIEPVDIARGVLESPDEYFALFDLANEPAANWADARPLAPGNHQCVAVPLALRGDDNPVLTVEYRNLDAKGRPRKTRAAYSIPRRAGWYPGQALSELLIFDAARAERWLRRQAPSRLVDLVIGPRGAVERVYLGALKRHAP